MDPTRLFTDARSTREWRKKEFFSVTESTVANGLNDSIMIQLLSHKMNNPKSVGEYSPETDELTCSENKKELGGYLEKHPNRGMPYGFPPLKQQEFEIIAGWLVQGAKGPNAAQQAELITPKPKDALAIKQWEAFLNQDDASNMPLPPATCTSICFWRILNSVHQPMNFTKWSVPRLLPANPLT